MSCRWYRLVIFFAASVFIIFVGYEELMVGRHDWNFLKSNNTCSVSASRRFVPNILTDLVTDLSILKGRHSDYVIDSPCVRNARQPSEEEINKFGFVGPFDYEKNYKNPCWFPNGSLSLVCVPYFYLIGFAKAGTTDIFDKIQAHPNAAMGSRKEVMWFNKMRFEPRSNTYTFSAFQKVFSSSVKLVQKNVDHSGYHGTVIGDGSPIYLADNRQWRDFLGNKGCKEPRLTVMGYIHHLWPEAKLILTIRNPAKRTLSAYLHFSKLKKLKKGFNGTAAQFDQRVRQSIKVWESCRAKRSFRYCMYSPELYGNTQIYTFAHSFYSRFLLELLKVFPREQIYVTSLESFAADAVETLRGIYKFLDLPPLSEDRLKKISNRTKKNTGKRYQYVPQMWPATKKLLDDFFAPYDEELWALLGDSLPRQW